MVVIYGINQRFAVAVGVQIRSDLLQNSTVERFCNYLAVEGVDFEFHIIFELVTVQHLAGRRIINGQLLTLLIVDALDAQLRLNTVGRVMINQITVNNSLAIRIVEDRFPENLRRMQRRGSCQSHLDGIKILNYRAILADIVILVAVEHFCFAHFLVQDISAVRLVNDYQVIIRHGGHCLTFGIEDAFSKALHRGNMYLRFAVNFFIVQALDIVDGIKGHQIFNFDLLEHILRLLTKSGAIHKE